MSTNRMRPLQWVVLVILVVAAGYGGLRFGNALRAKHGVVVDAPEFPFRPGDTLPDVRLADSLGTEVGSVELVKSRHGAVVLFLDPNCEGCAAMATRWEQGLSDGVIEPERLFAVTTGTAEVNEQYRAGHMLSYPIYRDVESAFLEQHGVVTYPMEVVVGPTGTIQSLSTDSKTPIDGESIRELIEH